MTAKSLVIVALSAWLTGSCLGAAEVTPGIAQVVKLHESNVGPEVLLAYVKETPIAKPNADEVLYLTEKGIPKEVIVTLLSKRVWAETPPPQSQPAVQTQSQLPPAVTAAQPATQTVVHVQPTPAVTYAAPYYPYYYPYYYRPYYNPWPAFSIGLGFGYGWGHGWHGHGGHHHHGIRVHHR
jgi:hypothetical protein